jgi:hypothetical protein
VNTYGISGISSLPSALDSARTGIRRGMSGLNTDAAVVASASAVSGDNDATTGALVDSLQQKLLVEASARMLSTEDQTLGTLLDVTA